MENIDSHDIDDEVDIRLGKAFDHYDYDLKIKPIEFVIDGFQSTGVTVIAGQPGVGKTSLLVPLYLLVAGLGDPDSSLRPLIRRKVVYVSEDPDQVQRILVGMCRNGGAKADLSEVKQWFIIKRARRLKPLDLQRVITRYRERYTHLNTSQYGVTYPAEPLIVLDTANATIDLENENDNSEVGQTVSLIKDAIGSNTPLVIVTHLAKAVSRGSVDDVSPRGASAWSGDVNAVQYVIKDDALENERFLLLGKRRFEAVFTEIRFETKCYFEVLDTPQGVPQEVPIRYAEAFKSSRNSRETAKQESQKRARQERELGLRQALLDATKEIQRSGKPCITRNALAYAVGGKKQTALEMIDRLIEDGQLIEEPLPAGIKAPSNRTNKTIRLIESGYKSYANRDEV